MDSLRVTPIYTITFGTRPALRFFDKEMLADFEREERALYEKYQKAVEKKYGIWAPNQERFVSSTAELNSLDR